MVGLKFNNWTILEATKDRRNGYIIYKCQCNCGNVEYKTIREIKQVKGNFCNQCRIHDLTGQKFTLLTPIEYLGTNVSRKSLWLCKCDCGNDIIVEGANLVSGNTKSCGCLKESAGEIKIRELLTKSNIKFETQKSFETCRFIPSNTLAKFDFYLLDYNILIEYDGI